MFTGGGGSTTFTVRESHVGEVFLLIAIYFSSHNHLLSDMTSFAWWNDTELQKGRPDAKLRQLLQTGGDDASLAEIRAVGRMQVT